MNLMSVYMNELGGRKPATASKHVIQESTEKPGDLEGPTKGTKPKESTEKTKKDLKKPTEKKTVKESLNEFDRLYAAAINEDLDVDFGSEIDAAAPGAGGDGLEDTDGLEAELSDEEGGEEPTLSDALGLLEQALDIVKKLSGGGDSDLGESDDLSDDLADGGDDLGGEPKPPINEEGVESESGENKGTKLMGKSNTVSAFKKSGGGKGDGKASGEEDGGKPKNVADSEGSKLQKPGSIDTKGVRAGNKDLFNN